MARKKIALIGAGQIGGTLALLAGHKELGDVVLFDIVEGMPPGQGARPVQSSPVEGFDAKIDGHHDYADDRRRRRGDRHRRRAAQAGHEPRRPDRDQRSRSSRRSARHQAARARRLRHRRHQPARCDGLGPCRRSAGFRQHGGRHGRRPRRARFRFFLAEEFDVSVEDVTALVLGGHGDTMVPLIRYSTVAGIPLPDLVKMGWPTGAARRDRAAHPRRRRRDRRPAQDRLGLLRARRLGDRDGRCLPQGPEAGAALRRLPDGEYGVKDLYVGVPVVIGAGGVERVVEIELDTAEKGASTSRSRRCERSVPRSSSTRTPAALARASPVKRTPMKIHEYQAKELLAKLRRRRCRQGGVAFTPERGRAGGARRCGGQHLGRQGADPRRRPRQGRRRQGREDRRGGHASRPADPRHAARDPPDRPRGPEVSSGVYVEQACDIARELYLGAAGRPRLAAASP